MRRIFFLWYIRICASDEYTRLSPLWIRQYVKLLLHKYELRSFFNLWVELRRLGGTFIQCPDDTKSFPRPIKAFWKTSLWSKQIASASWTPIGRVNSSKNIMKLQWTYQIFCTNKNSATINGIVQNIWLVLHNVKVGRCSVINITAGRIVDQLLKCKWRARIFIISQKVMQTPIPDNAAWRWTAMVWKRVFLQV